MVVNELDIVGIAILEPENNAPITGHLHAPKAFQLAFQRMQVPARPIEVAWLLRNIQEEQNILHGRKMIRSHLTFVVTFIEPLQAAILKRPDHDKA